VESFTAAYSNAGIPVYLFIFAGAVVDIEPIIFLESFIRVLLIPFITAVIVRYVILKFKGKEWFQSRVLEKIDFGQALFLSLAIAAMFAFQGIILIENLSLVLRLILPVSLFFLVNFSLGRVLGHFFNLTDQEGASLIITILARNAPLAIVIAVAVFPGQPLIPLVLAVESLIELPMLFIFTQLLLFLRN